MLSLRGITLVLGYFARLSGSRIRLGINCIIW